jgi:hypothetical protein
MTDIVSWVREYRSLLEWLGGMSLLMFAISLVAFPLVIVFLPQDYFVRHQRDPARRSTQHPAVWLTLSILKNVLGAALILAGIAMLVLPGQGLLAILVGVMLANFPGKYALERRLISRPAVAKAVNRIRETAGRSGFEIPADEKGAGARS